MITVGGARCMGPVEVSQAAKQIWRFGSQLSRGVWGSPAIFDVIPTTLPHLGLPVAGDWKIPRETPQQWLDSRMQCLARTVH